MRGFTIKAVLLDLDGTLVHTAPEISRAANSMLAKMNLPTLTAVQITTYIGDGATTLIKRCLTGRIDGAPEPALLATAQALFFEYYAQIVTESQPYPNALAGLISIKNAGLRTACVTNKPSSFTLPLLQKYDLLRYFDLIVSGDTLPRKKPEPDQILYVCEQFGVLVQDVAMVGDSKTDISAARSAGCRMFAVPYGYNQGQRIEVTEVDALIDNIGDVLDLVH
ncbi:MAG: phosphoglycolate phosphatase [Methylotenera sp.]|nr:phosphoglycolate phosphatase [Methylotenera sp.]MDP1754474.1 phosphoglycolate phosphatase [Methylotenera sp.]MDP1958559.1 phosphoglycolate phosphatase [Methylotenera sp.]MDP3206993.1 phosphoglycolate phosphatase [Methylotenera sp.]MDP3303706.1 phosphoglycolate phosphatase [Methylotenera sp.]